MRSIVLHLATIVLVAALLGCSGADSDTNQTTTVAPIDSGMVVNPEASHSNAELVIFEDFEDGEWQDSFDSTFNPANVSIAVEKSFSGTAAARMYGGYLGAAFDYRVNISEGEAYYFRYRAFYPSDQWNWDNISTAPDQSDNTGMKNFRAMPGGGFPLMMIKETTDGTFRTHSYFNSPALTDLPSILRPGAWPRYDVWLTHEIVVSWSNEAGGFAWYLDGRLISGLPFDEFTYATWPPPEGEVSNLRICGGNGYPEGETHFVDDIEIWKGTLADFLPGG